MKTDKKIEVNNFLSILSGMTPEEMNDYISSNGKGPKPLELVAWAHSETLENNIEVTHL
jgi:hypothetical protein